MVESKPWYRSSTFWIFFGLALGVVFGGFYPQDAHPQAYNLFHFLSKAFISLIKGLIVPLLVSTIIVGIAQTGDLKAVGRMGAKALLYFEIVTTLALGIGLVIANVVRPGDALPLDLGAQGPVKAAAAKDGWEIALHLFPSNLVAHAAEGPTPRASARSAPRAPSRRPWAAPCTPPGTSGGPRSRRRRERA